MKAIFKAAFAAAALAAVTAPANAQTVTSTAGTTSNVTAIQSTVSSNQMGGMKITATLDDNTSAFGFWADLGGGSWGVDLFSGATHVAKVTMDPGSADTYSSDWVMRLYQESDLKTLKFEGGAANGNVLFDRCSLTNSQCDGNGPVGTAQSDVGYDFSMNAGFLTGWNGITAVYTNNVTLNGAGAVGDLFTTVTVDFSGAQYCVLFSCSNDVPDDDSPNPTSFRMDTDKGTYATVPEPSTYALMAAGLFGVFGVARRRRNVAA